MSPAPIVLFAYNRPHHFKMTVSALQKNNLAKESLLYVFLDGSKNSSDLYRVKEVHSIAKKISGFKKVIITFHNENWGLANSIISGVSSVFRNHGEVIVLEDDLVTSPFFLDYMNLLLVRYRNDNRIFSISGYNHPANLLKIPKKYKADVYFSPRPSSWGWGTWKNRWETVTWDTSKLLEMPNIQSKLMLAGEDLYYQLELQLKHIIDSWAVRFCASASITGGLCIYPKSSLVDNIGMDGTGRHSVKTNIYKNKLSKKIFEIDFPPEVKIEKNLVESFLSIYKVPLQFKVIIQLKKLLGLL